MNELTKTKGNKRRIRGKVSLPMSDERRNVGVAGRESSDISPDAH